MKDLQRRDFIKMSAMGAFSSEVISFKNSVKKPQVNFVSDGLNLSCEEYLNILNEIASKKSIKDDYFSLGGSISELETRFASDLGKESAIFMPTGTLANHIAIRSLCGLKQKAIVQQESHIYNDSGDCLQSLSHINLVPIGGKNASFTLEEVKEVIQKTASGRVATPIGVISIESPVRRKTGEVFDFEEIKKISAFAKEKGIKMHLDGARIYLAAAYSGISVKTYASLFDTVYISLYKYFNAASGAILAGPKEFIEPLFHTRRMFGSGLHQSWVFSEVALHYQNNFSQRYIKAVKISETLFENLAKNEKFKINRILNGTNIINLEVSGISAKEFAKNLLQQDILINPKSETSLNLLVNESLLYSDENELHSKFIKALN